jgi:DHA1 family bicyclomycin/chloramphenicol resistance-like MFS transporter
MIHSNTHSTIGYREFVALMALMISLVALAIDTMLPALAQIGADFGVADPNDNQLVITSLFLGLAIGQLFYGPLSDSIGRKPCIYLGIVVFIAGCLLSLFATSFTLMIAGRLLQGLGVAGPRIVTVALIRDQYEGRKMAQVMSLVMTLFILMPVVAPALGQGILIVAHWRAIFAAMLVLALVAAVWFALRQPETLPPEKRAAFSPRGVFAAVRVVCLTRTALGYTLVSGLVSGLFIGFLSSSQQLLQIQYELGGQFPLYFAIIALSIGAASFVNARLVLRHGMVVLSAWSLGLFFGASLLYTIFVLLLSGQPPLWSFMGFLLFAFFCIGILFGNLNALAMQPLGHIAGVGAAVTGSLSVFLSLPIGILIGGAYDGTVLPLLVGFTLCSLVAIGLQVWTERSSSPSPNR